MCKECKDGFALLSVPEQSPRMIQFWFFQRVKCGEHGTTPSLTSVSVLTSPGIQANGDQPTRILTVPQ